MSSASRARWTCPTRRSSAASSSTRAVCDPLSREAQNSDEGSERLAVAASSEQILRILSVMGIDRVIPIRPTVDEAAAAISG